MLRDPTDVDADLTGVLEWHSWGHRSNIYGSGVRGENYTGAWRSPASVRQLSNGSVGTRVSFAMCLTIVTPSHRIIRRVIRVLVPLVVL